MGTTLNNKQDKPQKNIHNLHEINNIILKFL